MNFSQFSTFITIFNTFRVASYIRVCGWYVYARGMTFESTIHKKVVKEKISCLVRLFIQEV